MFFFLIVPLFLALFYKPIAYLCGRFLNNKSKRENYFMKHISNFLRSKSWNVFLFLYLALPLFAQKEYKIDQVSVVNVGDARLVCRTLYVMYPFGQYVYTKLAVPYNGGFGRF